MTFKLPPTNLPWIQDRTIFLTEHGSQCYGTATPTSDTDYKGVCIPPKQYMYGYLQRFEQAEWRHTPDMVIYDIRKFIKLAADCNPSILEVLFTDPKNHVIVTPAGTKLLEHRDLFVSKKAKHTFSGYAVAQAKKIAGHYRFLKNPPKAPPTRAEFGLPERTVIPADQMSAAQSLVKKKLEAWSLPVDGLDDAAKIDFAQQLESTLLEIAGSTDVSWQAGRALGFSDNFLELLDKERGYKSKMEDWRSYQEWKKNRNPARAVIEEKYGYDCKFGAHVVRLSRMGAEILSGKGVIVKRPDAEELLAIRNGAWTYEYLLEWTKKQLTVMDELYKTSTAVPNEPNREKLDALCISLVEESL